MRGPFCLGHRFCRKPVVSCLLRRPPDGTTSTACGTTGLGSQQFAGHVLHEKRLEKPKKNPIQFSAARNTEHSSSCGSTAAQMIILFSQQFKWEFVCSCFRKNIRGNVLNSLPNHARPRFDRAVVCQGFKFDRLMTYHCVLILLSKTSFALHTLIVTKRPWQTCPQSG